MTWAEASSPHRVVAYGSAGTLVELSEGAPSERATRTHAFAAAARTAWPDADVVVGGGCVALFGVSPDAVVARPDLDARDGQMVGHRHVIEAVYDGPDLEETASALGLSVTGLAERHAGVDYLVELVGFMPGFAYLACHDGGHAHAPARSSALAVPRRASPRPRVQAGSIGVAAGFTGIYPFASPGGWNLLGRAIGAPLFDPAREPPALLAPGDRVRFVVTEARPLTARSSEAPIAPARSRGLLVTRAPALATVQDVGRARRLAQGIAPAGPLDLEAMLLANAAVGNPRGAATVEVPLGVLEVEARGGDAIVSLDGEPARRLREGERFVVTPCDRAVRYLALRGGVDVPVVLGARATLLPARIGRPLRRGDLLPTGNDVATDHLPLGAPAREPLANDGVLAIDPGPHAQRFPRDAFDALLRARWSVSRHGDRVGVRLEGARVPREGPDLALPAPMIRGAIEIATDGTPIVLGPDHPTTGGYPVLAVLRASSRDALARRRPGDAVRFVT